MTHAFTIFLLLALNHSPAGFNPDQATCLAVNRLEPIENGLRLHHPRRMVEFTPTGIRMVGRRGAPEWRWQLVAVGTARHDALLEVGVIEPVAAGRDRVRYDRGALVEEYLARTDSIEQLFVVPAPLTALGGSDLVLTGEVQTDADFASFQEGWRWRSFRGEVTLGSVTVVDATGSVLPSRFEVTAEATRLTVDGAALATAVYPVTIDPEIGSNDFRISDMGGTGDELYGAFEPAVVYNWIENEYLVVWAGDDNTGGLANEEYEIWGQLLDASGGGVGSNDFRISDVGGTGDATYRASSPDVAFNPSYNQYFVVWSADDPDSGQVNNEFEIYGQVLDTDGGGLYTNDFRISSMGTEDDPLYDAQDPAVVFNPSMLDYLVCWQGDTDSGAYVNDEFEIWCQRIYFTGILAGDPVAVSLMGGMGNLAYDALYPDIALDSDSHQYLVVWEGEDNDGGVVSDEIEIYGQLLDNAGNEIGTDDLRLSDMGGLGDPAFDAHQPVVVYNPTHQEYLVAWTADDDTGDLVDNEIEVYAQRLDPDLGGLGFNDYRISDIGGLGDSTRGALDGIGLAYQPTGDEYVVCWTADDTVDGMVDQEFEVFCQRFTYDLVGLGPNDERVSDLGGLGAIGWNPFDPAVAANRRSGEYLVVWQGEDNVGGLVDNEYEILGQRLLSRGIFGDGFESGDLIAWSAVAP